MVRHRLLALGLAALAAAALPGCSSTEDTAGAIDDAITEGVSVSQLAGTWDLQSLAGAELGRLIEGGAKRPTLDISRDGRVSGLNGLNRYTTGLDLDGLLEGRFDLGPIAGTRMAGPPAAMELEQAYEGMLEGVRSFDYGDEVLILLDDAGEALASFVRQS